MRIFARYPHFEPSALAALAESLWNQQSESWPALMEGIAALKSVQVRDLRCDGTVVRLQYNPMRMKNIQARVDDASIARRKCFLCIEHLPEQQEGIVYRDEFLILCNPAPIFPQHFTVAYQHHAPQLLDRWIETFLHLAKDMQTGYTIFYNGPTSGASAPDHAHFQICPSGIMPLEGEVGDRARYAATRNSDGVTIHAVVGFHRGVLLVDGTELGRVEQVVRDCLRVLADATSVTTEPMINVLCRFHDRRWQVIIIPRKAHRPSCYFLPEPDRIRISPGAVDMGGLVVTGAEKDYRNVDSNRVIAIFQEVAMEDPFVVSLVERLG